MPADPAKVHIPPEDIDLFALIERCMLFFRRYRWVFIIAIVLGITSAVYFYRSIPTTYKSRMVVHSFLLTNQEEIQVVNNWNELLMKREYIVLGTALNCSDTILHKVKRIKAQEIQQVFSQLNPNGFIIDAIVTDNAVLDELEKALVFGFENNVYVKKRLDVKKATLRELIGKTGAEILTLDSTKKRMEGIIGGKANSSSSLLVDGSSVNKQLIEMHEKLLGFRESLEFTNAVQVLQGFEKFRQPVGPKLIPWLVIGLGIFLSLAYVFALFHSIRQGLKHRAALREKAN